VIFPFPTTFWDFFFDQSTRKPGWWDKKTHIFETFLRHDHRFTAQPHDIETKFGLEEAHEGQIPLGWLGSDNI
jgi:hypothetical protein